MNKKKALFISRPIAKPWDEASKNFVFSLTKKLKSYTPTVLVNQQLSELHSSVTQHKLYSTDTLSARQKVRLLKLRKIRNEYDIIHFFFTPTRTNTTLLKSIFRRSRAKTVHTIATLNPSYGQSTLRKLLWTDMIITYSQFAKRKLDSIGYRNVTCIYPGIDLVRYKPGLPSAHSLSLINLPAGRFIITFPGEYTRLGATDLLTELIPRLKKQIPNLLFIFACRIKNEADRVKKQEIKEKLEHEGLSDHVLFTDTFDDMPSLYNASDVIIFPVLNMHGKFDVPLAVIEAMACEKPVIISDLPVLVEFSSDQNAILVKTGNLIELETALIILYKNPKQRNELGKKARKYTEANYDISKIAAQYEKLYDELTRSNS